MEEATRFTENNRRLSQDLKILFSIKLGWRSVTLKMRFFCQSAFCFEE